MLKFIMLFPKAEPMLGHIPEFLSPTNPAPAREQLAINYRHGGGWHPIPGWSLRDRQSLNIHYPGDPPLKPLAKAHLPLTDETIVIYPHAWVMILQTDGSYEIARMD